jgi:hypothetical protein
MHPLISSRTCHHLARGGGVLAADDRHRRQVAVDLAQRPCAGRFAAGCDEFETGGLERVRGVRQARFDHRRRREFRDVEDRTGPVAVSYRFA